MDRYTLAGGQTGCYDRSRSDGPPRFFMLIRSKLVVPGSRTELFEKAANSAAVAISFDLEDAVAPMIERAWLLMEQNAR